MIGKNLGDRKGGFDCQADWADAARVNGVEAGKMRQKQFANDETCDKVYETVPVSVRTSVECFHAYRNSNTHGFGDRHCQKL